MRTEQTQGRKGFTLIELLVVIAIIGILAGILLTVFGTIQRRAKEGATRVMIEGLVAANATYEFDWGVYVPDSNPCYFPAATANGYSGKTPKGGEALYYSLANSFKRQPNGLKKEMGPCSKDNSSPYYDAPPNRHGDATGSGMDSYLDHFNQPIQYDNIREDNVGTGYSAQTWNSLADPRGGTPKTNTADIFSFGDPKANPVGSRPLGTGF